MCKKICTFFICQEQQETTNQIVQNRPSLLDRSSMGDFGEGRSHNCD